MNNVICYYRQKFNCVKVGFCLGHPHKILTWNKQALQLINWSLYVSRQQSARHYVRSEEKNNNIRESEWLEWLCHEAQTELDKNSHASRASFGGCSTLSTYTKIMTQLSISSLPTQLLVISSNIKFLSWSCNFYGTSESNEHPTDASNDENIIKSCCCWKRKLTWTWLPTLALAPFLAVHKVLELKTTLVYHNVAIRPLLHVPSHTKIRTSVMQNLLQSTGQKLEQCNN